MKITTETIIRHVARFADIPLDVFKSGARARHISRPRQLAMYLARELTKLSFPDIGRRHGGRDHTTVLHARRRVGEWLRKEPFLEMALAVLAQGIADRANGLLALPPLPGPEVETTSARKTAAKKKVRKITHAYLRDPGYKVVEYIDGTDQGAT